MIVKNYKYKFVWYNFLLIFMQYNVSMYSAVKA